MPQHDQSRAKGGFHFAQGGSNGSCYEIVTILSSPAEIQSNYEIKRFERRVKGLKSYLLFSLFISS